MTEKLYYSDAKLRVFTAHVEASQETDQGPAIRLDRTAFYPTGGGQSCDTGTIDGIPVLDVWTDEQGDVWHLLEALPHAGDIKGEINWERRFDHMQLHTGQHLLSAAFSRALNAPTIACHLGSESSTIDLGIENLSWEAAYRVEDLVNRVIWENRPVTAAFVADEHLPDLHLRREPKVEGPIRVVAVEGYDATPCGGTHTERTGEVGIVKITGIERYKGGIRVSFLCGERALKDYRQSHILLQRLSAVLTTGRDELPEAITRLQTDNKEMQRELNRAKNTLRDIEAERIWEETPTHHDIKHLIAYWPNRPFADIQAIAARLREHPQTLILLATQEQSGLRLVCTRSDDLPQIDAAAILRSVTGAVGGKGGGTPTMAQGGGPAVTAEAINAALENACPF